MGIIDTTLLPTRPGYVEVEVNGERQYQKVLTEQDIKISELEAINTTLQAAVDALVISTLEV